MQKRFKTNRWFISGGLLLVAFFVCLLYEVAPVKAAVGINKTINFQGRLLNSQGATVPDGFYNIQFKIYQDGDGQTAGDTTGSPSGSLKWTENYLNNNSQGVKVVNGYLSVQLGSINPFGSNIDWNQDTLWLSMNIGSTAATCTPFSSCSPDGEMVPMQPMTSSPYALNAGELGGLTSSQYVQLAQGLQTDASNATTININKTGSGNIMDLQSTGADVFTVGNSGAITIKNSSNSATAFQIQKATASDTLFTADTTNNKIVIGNSTGTDANTTLLVLDSAASDPATGYNGAQYYNTANNKFRCYQNGTWTDCITTAIGSVGTYSSSNHYADGATISGNALILGSADFTHPGLIDTSAQTFAGDKIFKSSTFTVQSTGGQSLLIADTAGSKVAIGPAAAAANGVLTVGTNTTASSGGIYFGTDTNLYRSGNTTLTTNASVNVASLQSTGSITTAGNSLSFTDTAATSGNITKDFITGSSVNTFDVVVMTTVPDIETTTAPRDSTVFGVSQSTVASGATARVATSGNYRINVDLGAVNIGDQLVTSTTAGRATVDNSATTGIIGTALSTKGGGANGTVNVYIRPVNGQYTPTFRAANTSATAFQVQNNSGNNFLAIDTVGNAVNIGITGSTNVNSSIHIADSSAGVQSVTIGSTNSTSVTTIQSGSNGVSLNGNTSIAGSHTFNTGTGTVGLNGDTTIASGKNFTQSGGGAFNTGTGNNNLNGNTTVASGKTFTVTDSATALGGNLDVSKSVAFQKGLDFSTAGTTNDAVFANASLIRLSSAFAQTITGIQNGRDGYILTIINGGALPATFTNEDTNSTDINRITTGGGSITLPVGASVTLVYDSNAQRWRSSAVASLQSAYNNSASPQITLDSTHGGLIVQDASSPIGNDLFTVQSSGATKYLNVTSSTVSVNDTLAVTGNETVSGTYNTNTFTSTALQFGGASGTISTSAGNLAVQANGTSTLSLDTTGAGTVGIATGNATTINIATNAVAHNIHIGDGGVGTTQTITIGSNAIAADSVTINAGNNVGAGITLGANTVVSGANTFTTGTGAVGLNGDTTVASGKNFTQSGAGTFSTGSGTNTLNGDTSVAGSHTFSTGTGVVGLNGNTTVASGKTFNANGDALFKTNSTTAFQVQNANNRNLLAIDTTTNIVTVGNSTDGSVIALGATGNANAAVTKNMAVTGAVNANDLVQVDTANDGKVKQAVANSSLVFGVATAAASSANDDIVIAGVYQVNADATALAPGDLLVSSSTAGKVTKAGTTVASGTVLGRALSTKGAGAGLVWVDLTLGVGGSDSLQTAYNNGTASTPSIKVNSTLGGVLVQDADTTINGSVFTVKGSSGGSLGNLFDVQSTGATLIGSTSQTASITLGQSTDSNTINIGNAATASGKTQAINIGASGASGSTTNVTIGSSAGGSTTLQSGTTNINSATVATNQATISVFSTNATNVTEYGAATTIGVGATTGTITFKNANQTFGNTAGSGTFTNNGATLNTTLALGDLAAGFIGTPAGTVDVYTSFSIAPTVSGRAYSIPTPTASTTYGRTVYISNIGSTGNYFTISNIHIPPGSTAALMWSNTNGGSSWQFAGAGGASIENQNSNDQPADFRISGTGQASTSFVSPLFDSITGGLSLGTVTATGVSIGGTTNTTSVVLQGAASATYTLGTSNNTGGITIGNSTDTNTIAIGNAATANGKTQTINIGTGGASGSTTNVSLGSTVAGTTTINGATGVSITGNTTISGSHTFTTGTGSVALNGDTTVASNKAFTANGNTLFQDATNSSTAFQIQNAIGSNDIAADTTPLNTNLTNSSFENSSVSTWAYSGASGGSVTRDTAHAYLGADSLKVITGSTAAAFDGVKSTLNSTLSTSTTYSISWYDAITSGSFTDVIARFSYDGTTGNASSCTSINTQIVSTNGWTRHSCQFVTGSSGTAPTSSNAIFIVQQGANGGTQRTFYIDAVQVEQGGSPAAYKETGLSLNGLVSSPLNVQNATNSTTAFGVQNTNGTNLFNIDSTNSTVTVTAGTVNTTLALGDLAAGAIGSAASTVDKYTSFTLAPTASGRAYTIPSPTLSTNYGRIIYLGNIAATGNFFTINNIHIPPGSTAALVWSNTNGGDSWQFAGAGGASIENQSTNDQPADFRISGTGRANTAFQSILFDTPSGSTTLSIGTTNATVINLNQNTTIASGKLLTIGSQSALAGACTTGAMYYDSTNNRFKGCENSVWVTLDNYADLQTYTSGDNTWTKLANVTAVQVILVGGGGGGGGGGARNGGQERNGGAGGGGGSYASQVFAASDLGSTAHASVGSSGTAGTGSAGASAGTNGGGGGASCFSSSASCGGTLYDEAFGGGGGGGGNQSGGVGGGGGGGGGTAAVGSTGSNASNTGASGGSPAGGAAGVSVAGGAGAGGGTSGAAGASAGAAGGAAEYGGGGGGGAGGGNSASGNGGSSLHGAGGGGAGGSTNSGNSTGTAGAGGVSQSNTSGGGGTAGSGACPGGNGGGGSTGSSIKAGSGGGGGGANGGGGAAGCVGGNGGAPGGGGGGGGSGSASGGNGGTGGAGEIWVISW